MTRSFVLELDLENFQGENWKDYCIPCHEKYGDCCKDLEMTLFPDEIKVFQEKDPKNVSQYSLEIKDKSGTKRVVTSWGYNAKTCVFLTDKGLCELQINEKQKPVDCLMYPINYKNQKIFLDTSCPAKSLGDKNKAKILLMEKLKQYPDYYYVSYEIMSKDQELDSF